MTLGERLRKEREARGWDLGTAAERCGMLKPAYWNLEAGKRGANPRPETLQKLAKGLGLPVHDLACHVEKAQGAKAQAKVRTRGRTQARNAESVSQAAGDQGGREAPAAGGGLPRLMGIPAVAAYFGVSRQTIHAWLKGGALPAELTLKVGGGRYFVAERLAKWVLERREDSGAA